MGDTEDAIRNLAAYIESMSSDARQLCRLLRRLIAANKIKVANFDDYPDPVRLGLAWGFIDAASQLASVDFAEIRPTLPILFDRLRVPTEPDTIDYDAWELAEKLARTKQPNFAKARDKAGSVAWKYIPAAFRWGCPGLGIPGLSGGVGIIVR